MYTSLSLSISLSIIYIYIYTHKPGEELHGARARQEHPAEEEAREGGRPAPTPYVMMNIISAHTTIIGLFRCPLFRCPLIISLYILIWPYLYKTFC